MMHEFYTAYSFLAKFALGLIFCLQSAHIYKFHLMLEINKFYFPTGLHLINPLNAELNPICPLLALLGARHIFHVSGLRVKCHCLL